MRAEPFRGLLGQWGSACSRMSGSCAECGGDSVPSPPWQKAAGVSEGEEAGGEEIAPRHFPADRACTQAVLALGYRQSLGCWGNTKELCGDCDDGIPTYCTCHVWISEYVAL